MAVHIFIIGLPATSEWWQQNLDRQVITAGFDNVPDGVARQKLLGMDEGDTVLAYCKGKGFVGMGLAGSASSWKFHEKLPRGSLSNHQSERAVQWLHVVHDVDNAVTLADAGVRPPRQTRERLNDPQAAKTTIALLRKASAREARLHSSTKAEAKQWSVPEAVRALGRPSSEAEIRAWLHQHHPGENTDDVRDNAVMFSVNDPNRRSHMRARKDFRSDSGHPKDLLFKHKAESGRVRFGLYDPMRDGIWTLAQDGQGRFVARQLPASAAELALAQAQTAEAQGLPLEDMPDERSRALRQVVIRQGRQVFRQSLLGAYGGRCAVTGCAVPDILEAAHIQPYRGLSSDKTSNGLLLRADIHTLFDKALLWFDEAFRVCLAPKLQTSEYGEFLGRALRPTAHTKDKPSAARLAKHREWATKPPVTP